MGVVCGLLVSPYNEQSSLDEEMPDAGPGQLSSLRSTSLLAGEGSSEKACACIYCFSGAFGLK